MSATHKKHGRGLSAAMADKGLSESDVAAIVGVSARTVRNWRAGVTLPSLEAYVLLRDIFGDYDGMFSS